MRSVQRSPVPKYFGEIQTAYAQWDDLGSHSPERQRIRNSLTQDFGEICAYCQQFCYRPYGTPKPNDESIDHFRPRHLFPSLWLDWLNLIYACRRCNQSKDDRWPGSGTLYDQMTDQYLSHADSRYGPVMEYVSPNENEGQRPAQEFFAFDVNTGEITPSEQLAPEEWSIANRTIWDLDLNSKDLRNLRLARLSWLLERLDSINDFDEKLNVMLRFMLPKMPFSQFIHAYVTSRFPLLVQISR